MNHQINDDAKVKLAIYNKKYRLENQERLNENKRIVYQLEKAKIKQKRGLFIRCDCGKVISGLSLTKHKKSSKHQKRVTDQFFS
jgi:hypothetical protein